ncbi:uncharacterized protein LOC118434399 [Folsomia candida]|nr:uncharacterized protein LOC118434399 [Folsomia candida]
MGTVVSCHIGTLPRLEINLIGDTTRNRSDAEKEYLNTTASVIDRQTRKPYYFYHLIILPQLAVEAIGCPLAYLSSIKDDPSKIVYEYFGTHYQNRPCRMHTDARECYKSSVAHLMAEETEDGTSKYVCYSIQHPDFEFTNQTSVENKNAALLKEAWKLIEMDGRRMTGLNQDRVQWISLNKKGEIQQGIDGGMTLADAARSLWTMAEL